MMTLKMWMSNQWGNPVPFCPMHWKIASCTIIWTCQLPKHQWKIKITPYKNHMLTLNYILSCCFLVVFSLHKSALCQKFMKRSLLSSSFSSNIFLDSWIPNNKNWKIMVRSRVLTITFCAKETKIHSWSAYASEI